ncbi:MAG: hypothetical protein AAB412_02525, partial [Elusimicrobiota bacterium]
APGHAGPRRKRHKKRPPAPPPTGRRKRHKARPKSAEPAPSRTVIERRMALPAGRWAPPVRDALEKLLGSSGNESADYDADNPPIAVLALDSVSMTNRPDHALFRYLVDHAKFQFDESFWKRIPEPFGRGRLRACYNIFHDHPAAVWEKDGDFLSYRKDFHRAHSKVCAAWGEKECSRWKLALLAGLEDAELRKMAGEAVNEALLEPVGTARIGAFLEDPDSVEIRTGLRKIPEIQDLCAALKARGFDLWLMSTSDEWSAQAFARLYGVDPARVVAFSARVAQGKLTEDILAPVPYGPGQAAAIVMLIGRSPALILGGKGNADLLEYGTGLRVLSAESQDGSPPAELREGWLFQPAFKPVKTPQTP